MSKELLDAKNILTKSDFKSKFLNSEDISAMTVLLERRDEFFDYLNDKIPSTIIWKIELNSLAPSLRLAIAMEKGMLDDIEQLLCQYSAFYNGRFEGKHTGVSKYRLAESHLDFALYNAARNGNIPDTIKHLVDANSFNDALCYAARDADVTAMNLLISTNFVPVTVMDLSRCLLFAVNNSSIPTIEFILAKSNKLHVSIDKTAALRLAGEKGNFELIKKFIKQGVEINSAMSGLLSKIAAEKAIDERSEEIYLFLVKEGATDERTLAIHSTYTKSTEGKQLLDYTFKCIIHKKLQQLISAIPKERECRTYEIEYLKIFAMELMEGLTPKQKIECVDRSIEICKELLQGMQFTESRDIELFNGVVMPLSNTIQGLMKILPPINPQLKFTSDSRPHSQSEDYLESPSSDRLKTTKGKKRERSQPLSSEERVQIPPRKARKESSL